MVQYLVMYSVQTGREHLHDDWWQRIGREFWQKQPGFAGIQRYSTLIGSGPDVVWEIDFTSGRDLIAALERSEAKETLEEFEHMVDHLTTKIIVPLD